MRGLIMRLRTIAFCCEGSEQVDGRYCQLIVEKIVRFRFKDELQIMKIMFIVMIFMNHDDDIRDDGVQNSVVRI